MVTFLIIIGRVPAIMRFRGIFFSQKVLFIVIFTEKSQVFKRPKSPFFPISFGKKTHFPRSSSSRHWMATKSPTHWHSHDRPFSKPDSRSRKPYMQYWWRTTRLKSQIKVILSAFSGSFAIVATVCTMLCISRIHKWQIGACGGHKDIVQFWWPCVAYFDVFNTVNRWRKRWFFGFFGQRHHLWAYFHGNLNSDNQ